MDGELKQKLANADKLFAKALYNDEKKLLDSSELSQLYINAVEEYLQIVKILKQNEAKNSIKIKELSLRANKLLDRVADLKKTSSTKITKPETIFQKVDNPTINRTNTLTNQINQLNINNNTTSIINSVYKSGKSNSEFNDKEISVLKASSFINDKIFLPWINGEETLENFNTTDGQVWKDPDGLLNLSMKQSTCGVVWLRPSELIDWKLFQSKANIPAKSVNELNPLMINNISPIKITQDIVSDCSFVCSLCIAALFEQKFMKRLITSIIYPQNELGNPIYNPSGKYLVKLHFNGIMRKVLIDDRLPVHANYGKHTEFDLAPLDSLLLKNNKYYQGKLSNILFFYNSIMIIIIYLLNYSNIYYKNKRFS